MNKFLFILKRSFSKPMKNAFFILFSSTMFIACGNKCGADIETEMKSGVVLVQNQSYYEIVLPNGNSCYFSGYDKEEGFEGMTVDKDSIETNLSYGTGFFISDKGQIATNAHVVASTLEEDEVMNTFTSFFDEIKDYLKEKRDEMAKKLEYWENKAIVAYLDDDVSVYEYDEICETVQNVRNNKEEIDDAIRELDKIHMDKAKIEYHSKISIALNDTHITSTEDLIPCVLTKKDEEHDIAIIETKNKKTPNDRHVFPVPETDPLENYNLMDNIAKFVSEDKNGQLYMTSFNYGPLLAITESGVNSQFNTGTISQRTDEKLMYSIPALVGSSGSPVVNKKMELVAINFASLEGTQNFNYGIKVKHLRHLINQ